MPKTYEPEIIAGGGSSPFDDMMYRWIAARNAVMLPNDEHPDSVEDRCLAQYDTSALDEAASVCDMLLNVPVYEADARLASFRDALRYTVQERAANAVLVERLSAHARDLAFEHVENAASWVIDSARDALDTLKLLKGIEDGDPEVWDSLPKAPNLSGEWAGHDTPKSLTEYCLSLDGKRGADADEDVTSDVISALADAYEQAVDERWEEACEKELTRSLGTGAERLANLARCAQSYINSNPQRASEALDALVEQAETTMNGRSL